MTLEPDHLFYALLGLLVALLAGVFTLLVRTSPAARQREGDELARRSEAHERILREEIGELRREMFDLLRTGRGEQRDNLKSFEETLFSRMRDTALFQKNQIEAATGQIKSLSEMVNAELNKMRVTVDQTLDKKIGESFAMVRSHLEKVSHGLGEMKSLAEGVGSLQKTLTNIKSRGGWGEIQLGALLEDALAPQQYAANVAPRPGASERVEFAIRLPGGSDNGEGEVVWLPIDAKFPQEDFIRLLDAEEAGDREGAEAAGKALERRLVKEAKTISEKYIMPPHTTDFAIMFLPSEGLYAEALRRPGLCETLQREHRVTVTGPTTLYAFINSLQMGFRTLAIQERAGEIWALLGAVQREFEKFGEAIAHTKRKIEEAAGSIEKVEVRSRAIDRTLKKAGELPEAGES